MAALGGSLRRENHFDSSSVEASHQKELGTCASSLVLQQLCSPPPSSCCPRRQVPESSSSRALDPTHRRLRSWVTRLHRPAVHRGRIGSPPGSYRVTETVKLGARAGDYQGSLTLLRRRDRPPTLKLGAYVGTWTYTTHYPSNGHRAVRGVHRRLTLRDRVSRLARRCSGRASYCLKDPTARSSSLPRPPAAENKRCSFRGPDMIRALCFRRRTRSCLTAAGPLGQRESGVGDTTSKIANGLHGVPSWFLRAAGPARVGEMPANDDLADPPYPSPGMPARQQESPFCRYFKPSDGLEPSTPSLPCAPNGNWSQPTAMASACSALSGSEHLPPVATGCAR